MIKTKITNVKNDENSKWFDGEIFSMFAHTSMFTMFSISKTEVLFLLI